MTGDLLPRFARGESDVHGVLALLDSRSEQARRLREALGGKGASLHLLAALSYRVPAGFTAPAAWCRAFYENGRHLPDRLREELARNIADLEARTGRKLGAGDRPLLVAVRSGAAESMPGMMDTVLGVDSLAGIERAVKQVFLSWTSERAISYRQERGIIGLLGTAVTVQEMCPAKVAGVAFSADPETNEDAVLVEAVAGLGESLVSGRVTPERYRLAKMPLEEVETQGQGPARLLAREPLEEIARTALELESRFGESVDIEWAIAGGALRPQVRALRRRDISASAAALLRAEAERLRSRDRTESSANGREPLFVRHNLDETIAHPTAMTEDIHRELLCGFGGLPGLYRDLGFAPAADIAEKGFLEVVCGRTFADVSSTAGLFYSDRLVRYDEDEVTREPHRLDEPPSRFARGPASPAALLRTLRVTIRSRRRVARLRNSFPRRFEDAILPRFLDWCRECRAAELAALSTDELFRELDRRVERVFADFPREALKLSFLAGMAWADLVDFCERRLGRPAGEESARLLASGLDTERTVDEERALAEVARGEISIDRWLEMYGHRAGGEMELATPRRWEDPPASREIARSFDDVALEAIEARAEALRSARECEVERVGALCRSEGGKLAAARFRDLLDEARALLPWRERWKDEWMRGVDLVRRVLVEIDARLHLEGMVFSLTRSELRAVAGARDHIPFELRDRVRERTEARRTARSVRLPEAFRPRDLERLADELEAGASAGRNVSPPRFETPPKSDENPNLILATPLALGRGAGRVWRSDDPAERPPAGGPFVLVTDSTDPGYTPLLARAAALVVERGGALSHGAIVCRDFGVPAVALRDARGILNDGEWIEVDGSRGEIRRSLKSDANGGGEEEPRSDTSDERAPARSAEVGDPDGSEATNALPPDGFPAEPWSPPRRRRLALRASIGLLVAVALSIAIVGIEPVTRGAVRTVAPVLDWTSAASLSPFNAIAAAGLAAAILGTALALLASDRMRLRQLRHRARWYRRELRRLSARRKREGNPETMARIDAARGALRLRQREASAERSFELLRPVGWSFLPFALAFAWVGHRFPYEPIRPGATFAVQATFRPRDQSGFLRFARLDVDPSRARLLDAPFQRLSPNNDAPELGPYAATWALEARSPGALRIAVTAREERVERNVLVTDKREFAPADLTRCGACELEPPEITAVEVDHPPLRVPLPRPLRSSLDRWVAWVSGGRGLSPEATTWSPTVAFLVPAVLAALLLQRLVGIR